MKETYYAIRIGDPRRNLCYLMVRETDPSQGLTPHLFATRKQAETAFRSLTSRTAKVVRVFVTTKP